MPVFAICDALPCCILYQVIVNFILMVILFKSERDYSGNHLSVAN